MELFRHVSTTIASLKQIVRSNSNEIRLQDVIMREPGHQMAFRFFCLKIEVPIRTFVYILPVVTDSRVQIAIAIADFLSTVVRAIVGNNELIIWKRLSKYRIQSGDQVFLPIVYGHTNAYCRTFHLFLISDH